MTGSKGTRHSPRTHPPRDDNPVWSSGRHGQYYRFDAPAGIETGAGSLVVVANGIPSKAVSITVK